MANTLLTSSIITKEALMVLHQQSTIIGTVDRQYDDRFAQNGAKIGNTLRVRKPPQYVVSDGATFVSQDAVEEEVSLTVNRRKHVGLIFTSEDLTMDIDMFSERFIQPAVARLASNIESDFISTVYKDVYRQYDNIGSAATLNGVLNVSKILTDELTPYEQRCLQLSTQDNVDMVNDTKGLFNPQANIADGYRKGRLAKDTVGFGEIYENTLMPRHTSGTAAAGIADGYLVNGASQTGSSVIVDGGTGTLTAGDIITFTGVNRVHPETKEDTGILQQFVVTADYAGGAGTIAISPAIIVSGGQQNVTASPADNAPISKTAGASASHGISMGYHKNAFTFATADLILPKGTDMAAREVMDGISMRLVRDYDLSTDALGCRLDILYGFQTLRPELACRFANN